MNHSPSLSAILHLQAIINHSVQALLSAGGEEGERGGGAEPPTKFSNRGGLTGKERGNFFQGGLQFLHTKKTKI